MKRIKESGYRSKKGAGMQSALTFPQPLTDRYRPGRIEDFLSLERPKRVMAKFAAAPRSGAFLFVGPPGTGKAGKYDKAMQSVANGSGDMHLLALLAIAKELASIGESVYTPPGARA